MTKEKPKIAIFGATGHIGKNLSFYFSQNKKNNLILFGRNEKKLVKTMNIIIPKTNYSFAKYDELDRKKYDVIINCVGIGNPGTIKKNTDIFKNIFGLNIPNRSYRTPLGHADGLKDNEKLQEKLKKIGVKYVSSDLRDADDGLNPPLLNKDNTPRQPYYYKNGLLEIPSIGWQDTVFSKTSKTPTKEKPPETYEEIINYYKELFQKAISISEENNKEHFLGLVLHPYDNSFYNQNNRFFYDLNDIIKNINAEFCKYEDVLLNFS